MLRKKVRSDSIDISVKNMGNGRFIQNDSGILGLQTKASISDLSFTVKNNLKKLLTFHLFPDTHILYICAHCFLEKQVIWNSVSDSKLPLFFHLMKYLRPPG